jgi:RHS repeat-associated protein
VPKLFLSLGKTIVGMIDINGNKKNMRIKKVSIISRFVSSSNARIAGPGLTANNVQDLKQKTPSNIKDDKPKAYLNYVFFDNQFKFVDDGIGVKQVDGEPGQLETLSSGKVVAKENGYVYVYTSNESQQDVLFDNFGVLDITGPILEETHYYPFGLTMSAISAQAFGGIENKYRYNGKELQDELGLNWYDYGARMYDEQIGRWTSIDPLSEVSRRWSPYSYSYNNPIRFIDIDGMVPGDYYNRNGEHLGSDGIDDNKVYLADSKTVITNDDGTTTTTFNNAQELSISHTEFRKEAATVYAESSIGYGIESKKEMFAIASVHQKNKIAFGSGAPLAKTFLNTSIDDQSGSMQVANAAAINALTGGHDFSNGARQWDGAEQAMVSKANMDKASNGRFMFKMNVMGWSIQDSHYKSWQSEINGKFGSGKFTVPQVKAALHNYGGMTNKGKVRLYSTAQYGLTIFWKEK